jgi:hypothetical protein
MPLTISLPDFGPSLDHVPLGLSDPSLAFCCLLRFAAFLNTPPFSQYPIRVPTKSPLFSVAASGADAGHLLLRARGREELEKARAVSGVIDLTDESREDEESAKPVSRFPHVLLTPTRAPPHFRNVRLPCLPYFGLGIAASRRHASDSETPPLDPLLCCNASSGRRIAGAALITSERAGGK